MIATAVFAMFSILVAVSYIGNFLPSIAYELIRDFLTMACTILIYTALALYFKKQMDVFKQTATDFKLFQCEKTFWIHELVVGTEVVTAILWAACLFLSSCFSDRNDD